MRKREVTSVRISADKLVLIKGAAIAEGVPLSTYIRDAAVERALEPSPPQPRKESE